jgi:hypothetical protein
MPGVRAERRLYPLSSCSIGYVAHPLCSSSCSGLTQPALWLQHLVRAPDKEALPSDPYQEEDFCVPHHTGS